MKSAVKCALMAWACLICTGMAQAQVLMTFEGLKDDEPVQNFYNGGTGGLGSGPGPNFGVSFGTNALALVRVHPFPGDPSPPTDLLLSSNNPINEGQPISMTMNVAAGFTQQLNYWDIAILRAASVTIWSGTNGSGTMLAQMSLPLQSPSNEAFTGAVSMTFSGTAHSVVFAGGDQQLVIDDISFGPLTSVPEPSPLLCSVVGLMSLFFIGWKRPKNAAAS